MNLLEALDELTRWQREAERLQKLLDTAMNASLNVADVSAQAVDTFRRGRARWKQIANRFRWQLGFERHRAREHLRAHLKCHEINVLGAEGVACALDYKYLLKLVDNVCKAYSAVKPDVEHEAGKDSQWAAMKRALDALPEAP